MKKFLIFIISLTCFILPCVGQSNNSQNENNIKSELFEIEECMVQYKDQYYYVGNTVFVSGITQRSIVNICKWACEQKGYTKAPGITFSYEDMVKTEETGSELVLKVLAEETIHRATKNMYEMLKNKEGSYGAIYNAISEYLGLAPVYYGPDGNVIREFSEISKTDGCYCMDADGVHLAQDMEIKLYEELTKGNKKSGITVSSPVYFVYSIKD